MKPLLSMTLGAALLVIGGGTLLSSRYAVVRSVVVNATPDKPFELVASPRRWKEWTVWNRRDPTMQLAYFGGVTGPGSGWSWRSKTEGDGRLTLVSIDPNRRVGYQLVLQHMHSLSTGELRFEPNGGATLVTWSMAGDLGTNPLRRWMGLLMDRLVGQDFEAGLANLKALAEKP
jgi:hypothetical protein